MPSSDTQPKPLIRDPGRLVLTFFFILGGIGLCLGQGQDPIERQSVENEEALPEIDFSRDIRPILADNCFVCHGADKGTRKARLRLDSFQDAIAQRRFGYAIVPGDLESSLLVERITEPDVEFRMPPPESGKMLRPEQIALLQRWIEQGAKYEEHWAFTSPRRPEEPPHHGNGQIRNAIDAFVLARLDGKGLVASNPATKLELIRRLSFDLTGLPPSIDEIGQENGTVMLCRKPLMFGACTAAPSLGPSYKLQDEHDQQVATDGVADCDGHGPSIASRIRASLQPPDPRGSRNTNSSPASCSRPSCKPTIEGSRHVSRIAPICAPRSACARCRTLRRYRRPPPGC